MIAQEIYYNNIIIDDMNHKIKVLWIHNFNPDSLNAGNFMYSFANHLKNDNRVQLDLMYLSNLSNPLIVIQSILKIIEISKSYDIVHAQYGSLCGLISAFAATKKIITLRGSDWHIYFGQNIKETLHAITAKTFTLLSLARYNHVFTVSNRMTKDVKKSYSKLSVSTLVDPLDITSFKPRDKNDARLVLTENTFSNSNIWILFTTANKNNPIKRFKLAHNTVEIVKQTFSNVELKIATDLDHQAMPLFVAACDIVLCTSTHEGWPNSIKEAMASGLPFVSTNVSDMQEIAKINKYCFVGEDNPKALSKLLIEAIRQGSDKSVRDEVLKFSFESISEKLINHYTMVVSK